MDCEICLDGYTQQILTVASTTGGDFGHNERNIVCPVRRTPVRWHRLEHNTVYVYNRFFDIAEIL